MKKFAPEHSDFPKTQKRELEIPVFEVKVGENPIFAPKNPIFEVKVGRIPIFESKNGKQDFLVYTLRARKEY